MTAPLAPETAYRTPRTRQPDEARSGVPFEDAVPSLPDPRHDAPRHNQPSHSGLRRAPPAATPETTSRRGQPDPEALPGRTPRLAVRTSSPTSRTPPDAAARQGVVGGAVRGPCPFPPDPRPAAPRRPIRPQRVENGTPGRDPRDEEQTQPPAWRKALHATPAARQPRIPNTARCPTPRNPRRRQPPSWVLVPHDALSTRAAHIQPAQPFGLHPRRPHDAHRPHPDAEPPDDTAPGRFDAEAEPEPHQLRGPVPSETRAIPARLTL